MAFSGSRTAFTAALLLDRRQQASSAAITAVAVDPQGLRLYLGLEDGVLEEHAILHGNAGVRTSLAARKHAAKKAISSIHLLFQQGLVVLLSEEGLVQLLDAESLEGRPLPLRNVVATSALTLHGRPPRLAVAAKPSKKSIRFLVYELVQAAGTSTSQPLQQQQQQQQQQGLSHPQLLAQTEVADASAAVHDMVWVGGQLAVCAGMRYLLVSPLGPPLGGSTQWQELLSVPEELAYSPAMLAAMPDLARAVLVVGPAGIVVDAAGSPVGSALRLDGLGATPRALAASGAFLLVVSEAGIHVFDRDSGSEVQRLSFGPGLRPAPGQVLHAAAAVGGSSGGESESGGGRQGCVVVAGRRLVWLCMPVSPADQARELLQQAAYKEALELIEKFLQRGSPWAQVAAAQAALLLLHECRFDEAMSCLEQCSPSTFQPSQLFPLFPTYTAPWAAQVPTHQQYWGLHAPLPSLETLITRKLGALAQQQQHASPASSAHHSAASGRGSSSKRRGSSGSSSLFALEGSSGGRSSPSVSCSPTAVAIASSSSQQPEQEQQQEEGKQGGFGAGGTEEGEAGQRAPQNGSLQPPAEGQQMHTTEQQSAIGGLREQLQRQAWQSIAQYLFRVRMLEGVHCLEGADTLLLLLLADLGASRQVAAFAAVPNHVHVPAVEGRLQAEQWHHALATLHAARGEPELALRIWRQVVQGELASPAGHAVQLAERREALESAAALLRDPAACAEPALVSNLPWLLAAGPEVALGVLTARNLALAAVLPLLPPDSDVRWRYLAHLVAAEGVSTQAKAGSGSGADDRQMIHTELAIQLAAAIQRADPHLRSPALPGTGPRGRASGGAGGRAFPGSGAGSGRAGSGSRRASRLSTAALVSGGSLDPAPGASPVEAMRLRLRAHLERSAAYDMHAVLRALQGTGLHQELVVLHCKMGDHLSALRLLAVTLDDVAGAEAYARAHLSPADWRLLLHLVLEPGLGLEPRWDDACYLITALGDHLDPQEVLQALPPGMPLAAATPVLGPMLRDRLHRRRQAALTKNLHRARLAAATGVLCDAQAQHVTIDEERACPNCHLRLGGKVFVVLQPGVGVPLMPQQAAAGSRAGAASPTFALGSSGSNTLLSTGKPGLLVHRASGSQKQRQEQQQQQQQTQREQNGDGEGKPDALAPPGDDSFAAAAARLQQQTAAGQAPQVLCYACYRRLAGAAPPLSQLVA